MKEIFIKNKSYLFIFILLIIYLIFVLFFLKKSSNEIVLIDGVDAIFIYKNNKWSYNDQFQNQNWKKYDVYSCDEYLGNYYLQYSNKWYAYDNDRKPVSYDCDIFAVSNDDNLSLITSQLKKADNSLDSIINGYLQSKKLTNYGDIYIKEYYNFDDTNEYLIYITNYGIDYIENLNLFSAVFVFKDGKYYDIKYNVSSSLSELEIYSVDQIFDMNKDNSYEIIIDSYHYSQPESSCYEIYQIGKKVSKLLNCNL